MASCPSCAMWASASPTAISSRFVGTNGAGKSTTMRLVNGLLKPSSGQVLIDGVPTTQLRTSQLAAKVGFLFQNPDRQICCSTVREELLFGFRAQGRADAEAEAKVDAMIERFGFDGDAEPFLLNRGTRQLLALASIIVMEPPVVVLDEPTTGLDFRECAKVMNVIAELNARGTTVIMVCHDMEVVADCAKRVIAHDRRSGGRRRRNVRRAARPRRAGAHASAAAADGGRVAALGRGRCRGGGIVGGAGGYA